MYRPKQAHTCFIRECSNRVARASAVLSLYFLIHITTNADPLGRVPCPAMSVHYLSLRSLSLSLSFLLLLLPQGKKNKNKRCCSQTVFTRRFVRAYDDSYGHQKCYFFLFFYHPRLRIIFFVSFSTYYSYYFFMLNERYRYGH